MIVITPYRSSWPDDFGALGRALRRALSDLALRIDHIGSTAVPGLAAKDRIDIQITVRELEPAVERALDTLGYARLEYLADHVPPGRSADPDEWVKWVFAPPDGQRPTNVHVRIEGRANQRYALLFRDYLRAHPAAAQAYGQVKQALARENADDVEAYYAVKDPVCDLIMEGAEAWAAATNWRAGPSDC